MLHLTFALCILNTYLYIHDRDLITPFHQLLLSNDPSCYLEQLIHIVDGLPHVQDLYLKSPFTKIHQMAQINGHILHLPDLQEPLPSDLRPTIGPHP